MVQIDAGKGLQFLQAVFTDIAFLPWIKTAIVDAVVDGLDEFRHLDLHGCQCIAERLGHVVEENDVAGVCYCLTVFNAQNIRLLGHVCLFGHIELHHEAALQHRACLRILNDAKIALFAVGIDGIRNVRACQYVVLIVCDLEIIIVINQRTADFTGVLVARM